MSYSDISCTNFLRYLLIKLWLNCFCCNCSVRSRAGSECNIGRCCASNARPVSRWLRQDAEPVNVRIVNATAVLALVPRCGSPATGHASVQPRISLSLPLFLSLRYVVVYIWRGCLNFIRKNVLGLLENYYLHRCGILICITLN